MNRLEEVTLRQDLDFKFEGRVIRLFDSKYFPIKEKDFSEIPNILSGPFIGVHIETQGDRMFKFYGQIPSYLIGHKIMYFNSGYEIGDDIKQEIVDLSTCPKHMVYSGFHKNTYLKNPFFNNLGDKLQTFEDNSISFFKNVGIWLYRPLRSILHL